MAVTVSFAFALFNIGVVILIVSFILKRILTRNFSPFDPFVDMALLVFFIVSAVSVLNSQFLLMGLEGIHKILRYLVFFIAAREIFSDKKAFKTIVIALLAGGALTVLTGLLQFGVGEDPLRGRSPLISFQSLVRVTAGFPNPYHLAIYLSLLIPLSYALARYANFKRFWTGMLMGLMLFPLGLTYCRPAALALGGAALFFLIVRRDYQLPLGLILCILGAVGFNALFFPPEAKEWLFNLNSIGGFFWDEGRHFHHQTAWNMIKSHPWFGVGINTFNPNYVRYRLPQDPTANWSAHQSYLQIAAETGLVGLLSFLILLFAIFRVAVKGYRKISDPFLKASLLGLMGGAVAFLVFGFFESNFWEPRMTYLIWFWLGLLCGAARLGREEGGQEPERIPQNSWPIAAPLLFALQAKRARFAMTIFLVVFLSAMLIMGFRRSPSEWASIFLKKGEEYFKKKDYDLAFREYEKATSVDPTNVSARLRVAEFLFIRGDCREALSHVNTVSKLGNTIPPRYFRLRDECCALYHGKPEMVQYCLLE